MTTIVFLQGDWCEHCGYLPDGSLTFEDEGTGWCVSCAFANGVLDGAEADALWEREQRDQDMRKGDRTSC